MYHIGVMARLREGQKSNEDPFVIKSALGASAGALGKIKDNYLVQVNLCQKQSVNPQY